MRVYLDCPNCAIELEFEVYEELGDGLWSFPILKSGLVKRSCDCKIGRSLKDLREEALQLFIDSEPDYESFMMNNSMFS